LGKYINVVKTANSRQNHEGSWRKIHGSDHCPAGLEIEILKKGEMDSKKE
jgi:hypothetical protein